MVSYLTQKTIKDKISFSGVGLHTGVKVNVCIKPAQPDTGIVFKRTDLVKNNLVYPNFMNVSSTSLNTTISNEYGTKVSTIEHLMGALFGLGIDNALIEIDNEEVKQKNAQCNNCGVIHKVTGICKSEILTGREEARAIISIGDIKLSLPSRIAEILSSYSCDWT